MGEAATTSQLRNRQLPAGAAPRAGERVARRASWILLVLMGAASVAGLVVPGLYPDDAWARAAWRGNDLVTLVVATPLLALSLRAGGRGPVRTTLRLAMLFYGVYNYAYYAFGAAFDRVFLLHVAALVAAVVGVSAAVVALPPDGTTALHRDLRVRLAALLTAAVGVLLVAAWGGMSLRFALSGQLPADVMPPAAVHLVYAIDLSLLAPAFLLSGALLLRGRPPGLTLACAVDVAGALYLLVLEVANGFQAEAGIPGRSWVSTPALGAAALCLAAAVTMLHRQHQVLGGRRTATG